MQDIETTIGKLQPGDFVIAAGAKVLDIQPIGGGLVIVDLDDRTSTAPIPAAAPVKIKRTVQ